MSEPISTVRNISDTARWVAYFRARETERPDALFRDPYAERLAGKRGFHIANNLRDGNKQEWAWVARTYLFDQFLSREIQEGATLVCRTSLPDWMPGPTACNFLPHFSGWRWICRRSSRTRRRFLRMRNRNAGWIESVWTFLTDRHDGNSSQTSMAGRPGSWSPAKVF